LLHILRGPSVGGTFRIHSKGIEMSEVKQGESGATSDKPKSSRNPLERIIVWGVIAALLVVVYFEFRANSDFRGAEAALHKALEDAEKGNDVVSRTRAEEIAKQHGSPTLTDPVEMTSPAHGKHQEAVYTWKSLLREQKLFVVMSIEDERLGDEEAYVIAIETEADRKAREQEQADQAAPVENETETAGDGAAESDSQ
jgi:hypothetical protein